MLKSKARDYTSIDNAILLELKQVEVLVKKQASVQRTFDYGKYIVLAIFLSTYGLIYYGIQHPAKELEFFGLVIASVSAAFAFYQIALSGPNLWMVALSGHSALLSVLYAKKQVMIAEEMRDMQKVTPVPFSLFSFPNLRN